MMFFLGYFFFFFFFKQKTAYEMSIGDWSSDVCSSDLLHELRVGEGREASRPGVGAEERVDERRKLRHASAEHEGYPGDDHVAHAFGGRGEARHDPPQDAQRDHR